MAKNKRELYTNTLLKIKLCNATSGILLSLILRFFLYTINVLRVSAGVVVVKRMRERDIFFSMSMYAWEKVEIYVSLCRHLQST